MLDPQQLAAIGCISSIMPWHAPPAWRRRGASEPPEARGSGAGAAGNAIASARTNAIAPTARMACGGWEGG